mgnify:CR=1 FL=1|tara:strand:- start:4869 stop:5444 length:576 start_codon:yes stop_codon:yes gene_type:complete
MEIKKFIKIYDNVLPIKAVSSFLNYCNSKQFHEANVGEGDTKRVDFEVRRTFVYQLTNQSEFMTEVHWCNLLYKIIREYIARFKKDLNIHPEIISPVFINDISILKYETGGFYTWHTDHFNGNPRTFSCIYLLNNDYEGGKIVFANPDLSGQFEIDVVPNRLIVWPSNFMFPHRVNPVTKGVRYSVVAWAL